MFHETVRDLFASGANKQFGEGTLSMTATPGPTANGIIKRAYVHEVAHQFINRSAHDEGGYMWPNVVWAGPPGDIAGGLEESFSDRIKAFVRSTGRP